MSDQSINRAQGRGSHLVPLQVQSPQSSTTLSTSVAEVARERVYRGPSASAPSENHAALALLASEAARLHESVAHNSSTAHSSTRIARGKRAEREEEKEEGAQKRQETRRARAASAQPYSLRDPARKAALARKLFRIGMREIAQNPKSCPDSLKEAADFGHAEACYEYAFSCYSSGNLTSARRYFELAAQQNHPVALYNHASMCFKGEGGSVNKEKAAADCLQAADLGYAPAQLQVGIRYQNFFAGREDGIALSKKYLKKAADSDDIRCRFVAAYRYALACYQNGATSQSSLVEARKYLAIAAAKDFPKALLLYAKLCLEGKGGPADFKMAMTCYHKMATIHNHADSYYRFAVLNFMATELPLGTRGQISASMLEKASLQNHKEAKELLDSMRSCNNLFKESFSKMCKGS